MRVPVLSTATIFVFPVCSSAVAFLKRIPFDAPLPEPAIIATGVARPRAHGQLITSTEIPRANENPTVSPTRSHTVMVTNAIARTMGTNTPETLSAILAMGAFVAAASVTAFIIPASAVSVPTFVARQRI